MSKRGKQIQINISNRALYSLIAILVGLLIVGVVYAYNPSGSGGNPAIMGHSADEIYGAVGGVVYDSGWISVNTIGANPYDFVHNLDANYFSSIEVQLKDANNIPVIFSGSHTDFDRAPSEYNKHWGWYITLKNSNILTIQRQTSGWLSERTNFPTGWAGNTPTHVRLILKK